MLIQQFFQSLLWAITILIALSIGVMSTAVVLQQSHLSERKAVERPTIKEPLPKMVSIGRVVSQNSIQSEQTLANTLKPVATLKKNIQKSKQSIIGHTDAYIAPKPSKLIPHYEIQENVLSVYFPKDRATHQAIKRALTRLLLSEYLISASDLFSTRSVSTHNVPFFYGKVVDQNNQPMRYPADVYHFIDYLLSHPEDYLVEAQSGLKVVLPLKAHAIGEPIHKYQQWVSRYAKQFSVNPALVFAIMETESGFDPYAVSQSNALGLMQLKPEAAGQDVYRYIDFKTGEPEPEELFDSQNNIRMGTAYLGMLQNEYLAQIRNKLSKKILAIAAYNGGLSTVLKLFGGSKESAIERINRLNPKQIYRKLRQQHQSAETRAYLDKVLKAEMKYQKILG